MDMFLTDRSDSHLRSSHTHRRRERERERERERARAGFATFIRLIEVSTRDTSGCPSLSPAENDPKIHLPAGIAALRLSR